MANGKVDPEWFQTFTFADDVMAGKTIEERGLFADKVLDEFKRRALIAIPELQGIWRREWKRRKSGRLKGELCPHYHLLLSAGLTRENFRKTAQLFGITWVQITKSEGLDAMHAFEVAIGQNCRPEDDPIRWIEGVGQLRCYLGKYMAKEEEFEKDENGDAPSFGRAWGKVGQWEEERKEDRPYSQPEGVILKRLLKRYAKAQYRRQRSFKKKPGKGKTFKCFGQGEKRIVRLVNDPWGYLKHKQYLQSIEQGATWIMIKKETTQRILEYIDQLNTPPF